jgi:hypothetical protein
MRRRRIGSTLVPPAPLLSAESEAEFNNIRDALTQEIRPSGIIDQMWVDDIACGIWETARLRRCKAGIINAAFVPALKRVLTELLRHSGASLPDASEQAAKLAGAWFTERAAKKEAYRLLKKFRLDEMAIEAEAIRHSLEDLEVIDRLLASLEARRNRALRCLTEYREILATKLKQSSKQILDGKVLALEDGSKTDSSAAA